MDEVEIHIVELKLLERGIDGVRNIPNVVDDFGRDEEFLSWDSGFLDCESKFWLGVVELCAVEMSVA